MAASFLHGVETIEITGGVKPVRAAKTAVIGLVGTAPIHRVLAANRKVDLNVLCLSDIDDSKYFGPDLAGYSIPAALKAIRAQGAGLVIVVNVFDPATHHTDVAAAEVTLTSGVGTLSHGDVISETVHVTGGTGNALVEGTDYSIDRTTGVITALADGALDGDAACNVAFIHGNPAAITSTEIIGTVTDGVRSGAQKWLDCKAEFGYSPKILIAPGYSTGATTVAALAVLAQQSRCRAVYIADAPSGTTVQEAITGRGPLGDINFNFSDDRGIPVFPYVQRDSVTDLQPLSSHTAGVIAATDVEKGFWFSPSNKVIKGIIGLELPISASINDPLCEANALNEVGIVTVFNAFGTGFRLWGNRSSAFPASTGQTNFIQARRVADQIHESLEMAMLDFLDLPITDVVIQAVLATCNGYMNTLIARGAVPNGSRIEFNTGKNSAVEIAAGHLTFDIVWAPNPPLERVTFESFIDITLLGR
jgi:uncharacterized protein